MSLLRKLMVPAFVLASSFHVHAQIKNAETITAKVSGNCGMCEATIEKAGSIKKEAQVEWDKDKQVATITYDPQKTTADQVLKRIALAGYDNEKFLAPEEAYNNLHGCCQYERLGVAAVEDKAETHGSHQMENSKHTGHNGTTSAEAQSAALAPVMTEYFRLQQALVKSDAKQAAAMAAELQKAIGNVDMASLGAGEHTAWMKAKEKLSSDAAGIARSQDLKKQRQLFSTLSENLYPLAKAADLPQPVYYNNCPMFNDGKGANWLSEEKAIKNPYYGSQMLTCGKNIETIE
jgi:copper chaperone CopZ